MSDTSGEDWLVERLADVGKAWKEDVARLTSRIAELERAAETLTEQRSRAEIAAEDARRMADEYIAEAERAVETSRAEHAAALGLATARIRELEGERDELLDFTRIIASMNLPWWTREARAIVARIEKAAKGTT